MFDLNNNYPYEPEINEVALKLFKKNFTIKNEKLNVLDLGCGYATLIRQLNLLYTNINFCAIEASNKAIKKIPSYVNLIKKNIEHFENVKKENFFGGGAVVKGSKSRAFYNEKFDAIILSDTLEHLYDPVSVVNFYKKLLKTNGVIIITVPNIANFYSRLSLLFGNFNYTETGVNDKTHIRYFNKKNLELLSLKTKLKIKYFKYDSIIIRWFVPLIKKILVKKNKISFKKKIINSEYYKIYLKFIKPIEEMILMLWPNLFAFRIGVILEKN
jgi:2-polyprenyl-3-methyl-5-hydroxy-6-metoxy-1,4-benzoquinol methylase